MQAAASSSARSASWSVSINLAGYSFGLGMASCAAGSETYTVIHSPTSGTVAAWQNRGGGGCAEHLHVSAVRATLRASAVPAGGAGRKQMRTPAIRVIPRMPTKDLDAQSATSPGRGC